MRPGNQIEQVSNRRLVTIQLDGEGATSTRDVGQGRGKFESDPYRLRHALPATVCVDHRCSNTQDIGKV